MRQQTIYIPAPHSKQSESPVRLSIKPKRKTIHINAESVKNKLLGMLVIAIGIFTAAYTGDGTAMVFTSFIGLAVIIG